MASVRPVAAMAASATKTRSRTAGTERRAGAPDRREVPGIDHIPWVGDPEPILTRVEALVTGPGGSPAGERALTTVLAIDSDGRMVREQAARQRGVIVRDGLVTFDGPGRAIACASDRARRDPHRRVPGAR